MAHDLPAAVRAAISAMTVGQSLAGLAEGHAQMSAGYRDGRTSKSTVRGASDVAAYLIGRLPATYAAVHRVLDELTTLDPTFAPATVADIGCGPGTSSLAALDHFPDIRAISALDASGPFLNAAPELLEQAGYLSGRRLDVVQGDFRTAATLPAADLVLLSYALVECPEKEVADVARRLWAGARGALVLVEPGTPTGFARIRLARDALVAAGASLLAPCPHQKDCPLIGSDWCHFSVRLSRSREHRRIKGADAPFEDEKFSYLIALRSAAAPSSAARIIAPVLQDKAGSLFRLCTETGVQERHVPKRDPLHKQLRKRSWGDVFPDDFALLAREGE